MKQFLQNQSGVGDFKEQSPAVGMFLNNDLYISFRDDLAGDKLYGINGEKHYFLGVLKRITPSKVERAMMRALKIQPAEIRILEEDGMNFVIFHAARGHSLFILC